MKTVTAAIIIQNGNVFLCRRAPGEKLAGFWEFPGGKLEPGESLQQCLDRELREELGIETRAGEIIARSTYCYEHDTIELIGIRTEIVSGKPELRVHDRIVWAALDELTDFRLAPADIPLAATLEENV